MFLLCSHTCFLFLLPCLLSCYYLCYFIFLSPSFLSPFFHCFLSFSPITLPASQESLFWLCLPLSPVLVSSPYLSLFLFSVLSFSFFYYPHFSTNHLSPFFDNFFLSCPYLYPFLLLRSLFLSFLSFPPSSPCSSPPSLQLPLLTLNALFSSFLSFSLILSSFSSLFLSCYLTSYPCFDLSVPSLFFHDSFPFPVLPLLFVAYFFPTLIPDSSLVCPPPIFTFPPSNLKFFFTLWFYLLVFPFLLSSSSESPHYLAFLLIFICCSHFLSFLLLLLCLWHLSSFLAPLIPLLALCLLDSFPLFLFSSSVLGLFSLLISLLLSLLSLSLHPCYSFLFPSSVLLPSGILLSLFSALISSFFLVSLLFFPYSLLPFDYSPFLSFRIMSSPYLSLPPPP